MTGRFVYHFIASASLALTSGCGSEQDPPTDGAGDAGDRTDRFADSGNEPADAPSDAPSDAASEAVDPITGLPFCGPSPTPGEPCADESHASVCPVSTEYPGDDLALCGDREGVLLMRYGPSSYDDPDAVAPYLLEPGDEDETCLVLHSSNEEEFVFRTYHGRLRPNSHHVIVYTHEGEEVEDTPVPQPCNQAGSLGRRWLVGSQDPAIDVTMSGVDPEVAVAPDDPDYNVVGTIPPNVPVTMNVHYINTTEETILKEAWVAFDEAEPSDDLVHGDMLTFINPQISIPPNDTATTEPVACVAPTERYVGLITGHFHENGLRVSAWKEDLQGERTLVYETYDWADPGNLFYRDGIENPSPNPQLGTVGGSSGYLHLEAGEAIVYQCEFHNPTNVTVGFGLAGKDQMCNIFGFYYPSTGNVWDC